MTTTALLTALEAVPPWLLHTGWQAGLLALLVLLADRLLRERLEPRWRFCLWLLVFLRLALPILPDAPWSVYQLAPAKSTIPPVAVVERPVAAPAIPRSLPVVSPRVETVPADLPADEPVASIGINVPWIAVVWLAGVLLLLARQAWLHVQLQLRMRTWRAATDPLVRAVFDRCRRELGVVRPVRLRIAPLTDGPATCGVFLPTIVLPDALLQRLGPEELRLILLHELTHVRRHDVLLDRFASLLALVHWVNPVAWLALARLRHERELACDGAVLRHVGDEETSEYGRVLLHVAEQLSVPTALAGTVGVFGKDRSLVRRIHMIAGYKKPTSASMALGVLLLVVLGAMGLTESAAQTPRKADGARAPEGKSVVAGVCQDEKGKPLAGVRIALYHEDRVTSKAKQVKSVETDDDGRFRFADLAAPPAADEAEAWGYGVVVTRTGRGSLATSLFTDSPTDALRFKLHPAATLRGRVTDPTGKPVAGARVWTHSLVTGPVEGVGSTHTDTEGRYAITDMAAWGPEVLEPKQTGEGVYSVLEGCYFDVLHPEYAQMRPMYRKMPDTVDVVLQRGGTIEGKVMDEVTGQPAKGVAVSMQATDKTEGGGWQQTRTDADGKYHLRSIIAGKYNVWADAPDRASAALDSIAVEAGKTHAAPNLKLTEGGWIEGRLVAADSGKPISGDVKDRRLAVGLYGPSRPKSGAACQSCPVDDRGRFRLRVAAGVNYPYLMNQEYWRRAQRREYFEKGVEVKAGEVIYLVFRILPTQPIADPEPAPVRLPVPVPAEREAAAIVRQLGGWYQVDADKHVVEVNMVYHETPEKQRFDNDQANTDEALRIVGSFPRLKRLFLKEGQATDDGLQALAGLEKLEVLYIWDATRITDAGIERLAGLKKLRDVHVSEAKLGDGAMAVFAGMPGLRSLSLQGNAFSDEGLKHLAGMTQLRSLWVGSSRRAITDAGVKHLAGLTNLEQLDLQHAQLTDAGVATLKGLKQLRTLYLAASAKEKPLTDACIEHLLGMSKLQQVGLQNTRVTDAGVLRLLELKDLKSLMFSSTASSAGLRERLQNARPGLQLYLSSGTPDNQE